MNVHIYVCVSFQECVCVYTLEGDSRLLSEDPPHELPQEGKIRCVYVCVSMQRAADVLQENKGEMRR